MLDIIFIVEVEWTLSYVTFIDPYPCLSEIGLLEYLEYHNTLNYGRSHINTLGVYIFITEINAGSQMNVYIISYNSMQCYK